MALQPKAETSWESRTSRSPIHERTMQPLACASGFYGSGSFFSKGTSTAGASLYWKLKE